MNRRQFLGATSATLGGALLAAGCTGRRSLGGGVRREQEVRVDVLVVGGGLGGCAAAWAAAEAGCTVALTEETSWLGGQATSQGVPPDEHPWIEEFGCTRRYRAYREAVRAYYRAHFPLTPAARANPRLNPGNGWVSALCHEPRVSAAVLDSLLSPQIAAGRLEVWREHEPVACDVDGDELAGVTLRSLRTGRTVTLTARRYIDATELGDLLPLAGVEHVIGAESRDDTGEPHAPTVAIPASQQAVTWCFAVEHRPGENHVGDRPDDYDYWRSLVPPARPPWPGRLLAWEHTSPVTLESRRLAFDPGGTPAGPNLWTYRRLRDPANFEQAAGLGAISLVNWPQNDYWLNPLLGVPKDKAAENRLAARRLSRALLHWLQTEAPRPDGGTGWPGLRLNGEVMGTADGFAKRPYIRESRRIRAEFTVVEQHLAAALRPGGIKSARAEAFPDSVGVGAYRIDLHPTAAGENYLDLASTPFQIPLGALLPRRVNNLLAGAKTLGVTHITNGCFRLHPVEWNVGEAAGALAAHSIRLRTPPRAVRAKPRLLAEFQRRLENQGFELAWPASVHPL